MDHTAKLRSMKGAIEEMQNGEKAMAKKDFFTAEGHFRKASLPTMGRVLRSQPRADCDGLHIGIEQKRPAPEIQYFSSQNT